MKLTVTSISWITVPSGLALIIRLATLAMMETSLIPKRRVIRGKISYYKNILEEMAREEDCKRQNN